MKNTILKLFVGTILISTSCTKPHQDHENAIAFSLSDEMMAQCKFHTTSINDVKDELRLFGKIQADNKKLASVYSIVGGNVITINAELGDYVKKGAILATVRSSEIANLEKQRLDAINDKASAEKNLQVAKDMFEGKLASEKDVIAAQREFEKAKGEVNRINEVYQIYHLKEGSVFDVIAPISGFIMEKHINQNEQIRSDKSDVLYSIAEINEVWAMANVNESDIGKVQIGYDAEVSTISFPDDHYLGHIDKIFNTIDPETKAMKVRIKIPNPSFKLKPEMNATVTVRFKENKKMIAIPASAVIFDKSKNWVMVFKNRHNIETRKIEVYRQIGKTAYISSGLKEGEKIIAENGLFVYDAIND